MKSIRMIIICVFLLNSCKNKNTNERETSPKLKNVTYKSFGKTIIDNDAISVRSMLMHYNDMNIGDSINSKLKATVKAVCQAKGCWMTLALGDDNEVMVTFKDYDFFVPKNISGKEVIINVKAYVKEVSIEEQKHYAVDVGKRADEIAKITKTKNIYSFEADGVLLKQ